MQFNWIKIDNMDWKCTMPNGDMLRVERMNMNYVWWCFYHDNCQFSDCEFETIKSFPKTIKEAKKQVEMQYQLTLKSN